AEFERAEDLLAVGPDGVMRMGGHGDEGGDESLVEVWSRQGGLLYRSEALGPSALGDAPSASRSAYSSSVLRDGTPVRVLTRVHPVGDRAAVVRVAFSEERQRKQGRALLLGLLLSPPAAIAIAALGGHWLARRVLGPLDRMARQAESLTADNL